MDFVPWEVIYNQAGSERTKPYGLHNSCEDAFVYIYNEWMKPTPALQITDHCMVNQAIDLSCAMR